MPHKAFFAPGDITNKNIIKVSNKSIPIMIVTNFLYIISYFLNNENSRNKPKYDKVAIRILKGTLILIFSELKSAKITKMIREETNANPSIGKTK